MALPKNQESKKMPHRKTEIGKLSIPHQTKLAHILDNNDCWAKLMGFIPKKMTDLYSENGITASTPRKYTSESISVIRKYCESTNTSPAARLIEEWGSSGRERATIGDLLELLIKLPLFRAADFVAKDILNEPEPERPKSGPAKRIDIRIPDGIEDIESQLEHLGYPRSSSLKNGLPSSMANANKDYRIDDKDEHLKFPLPLSDLTKYSDSSDSQNESESRPNSESNVDLSSSYKLNLSELRACDFGDKNNDGDDSQTIPNLSIFIETQN